MTKNGGTKLSSQFTVCDRRKLRFIKEQKAGGLLSSLGTKIKILSKLDIARDIYFKGKK